MAGGCLNHLAGQGFRKALGGSARVVIPQRAPSALRPIASAASPCRPAAAATNGIAASFPAAPGSRRRAQVDGKGQLAYIGCFRPEACVVCETRRFRSAEARTPRPSVGDGANEAEQRCRAAPRARRASSAAATLTAPASGARLAGRLAVAATHGQTLAPALTKPAGGSQQGERSVGHQGGAERETNRHSSPGSSASKAARPADGHRRAALIRLHLGEGQAPRPETRNSGSVEPEPPDAAGLLPGSVHTDPSTLQQRAAHWGRPAAKHGGPRNGPRPCPQPASSQPPAGDPLERRCWRKRRSGGQGRRRGHRYAQAKVVRRGRHCRWSRARPLGLEAAFGGEAVAPVFPSTSRPRGLGATSRFRPEPAAPSRA